MSSLEGFEDLTEGHVTDRRAGDDAARDHARRERRERARHRPRRFPSRHDEHCRPERVERRAARSDETRRLYRVDSGAKDRVGVLAKALKR